VLLRRDHRDVDVGGRGDERALGERGPDGRLDEVPRGGDLAPDVDPVGSSALTTEARPSPK
jgi:hypothetical protein